MLRWGAPLYTRCHFKVSDHTWRGTETNCLNRQALCIHFLPPSCESGLLEDLSLFVQPTAAFESKPMWTRRVTPDVERSCQTRNLRADANVMNLALTVAEAFCAPYSITADGYALFEVSMILKAVRSSSMDCSRTVSRQGILSQHHSRDAT